MSVTSLLAQEMSTIIPEEGGGAVVMWVILAAGIVGLYVVISRTRKRSYRTYMTRSEREAAIKANDPDLKKPDDR